MTKIIKTEDFLEMIPEVRVERGSSMYYSSNTYHCSVTDVTIPKDIHIEVIKTAAKGTIGELIGMEVYINSYSQGDRLNTYNTKFVIECENRKKPVKLKMSYCNILAEYDGKTEYTRTKPTKRKPIPPHTNKFKQELIEGTLIIGATTSGTLGVGKVSRWTKSNVWIKAFNGVEQQMYSTRQNIAVEEEQIGKTLTFAKLAGWEGF